MLIAQMVGRNEADRYLVPVLDSLKAYVDLIVFTDDSSDDDTPQIASQYGSVMQTDRPLFNEDEGMLRSLAWSHLEQYANPGDWVLSIDCDEILYQKQYLAGALDQSQYDVLGIMFFHMWTNTQYRTDKAWRPNLSHRLYRYFEGGEFKDRKLACGAEPTYVEELIRRGRVRWDTGLVMQHLGYMRDEDKIKKYERYMQLDGGMYHSRMHLESILDRQVTLADWIFND